MKCSLLNMLPSVVEFSSKVCSFILGGIKLFTHAVWARKEQNEDWNRGCLKRVVDILQSCILQRDIGLVI